MKTGLLAALAVAALAVGCSAVTREAPVRQTFLLEPKLPPASTQSQPARCASVSSTLRRRIAAGRSSSRG